MADYLETSFDKFVFRVQVGAWYSREDFWVRVDDGGEGLATVGVTDFLQKVRGDVAFLETVAVGTEVHQGQELGTVETIKATFAILSPVTGKVVEVNPELDASAYLVNQDPYGSGWLYKIQLADYAGDKPGLLSDEEYLKLMEQKIAQEVPKK